MDREYFLTIYRPVGENCAVAHASLEGIVLRLTVNADIGWVKQHADDIACRQGFHLGRGYCALWVSEEVGATAPHGFAPADWPTIH